MSAPAINVVGANYPVSREDDRFGRLRTQEDTERVRDPRGGHVRVRQTMARNAIWLAGEDARPVNIVNGFGAGIEDMETLARALAGNHGRKVHTYDDKRVLRAHTNPLRYRAGTYAASREHYSSEGIGQPATDVGWSTGGVVALMEARRMVEAGQGEEVGPMMLVGSAGLIGPDKARHLAGRTLRELRQASPNVFKHLSVGRSAIRMTLGYISRDPLLCVQELFALAATDATEDIVFLRNNGIRVGIAGFTHDRIFPFERMSRIVEETGLVGDDFFPIEATHVNLAWKAKVVEQMMAPLRQIETSSTNPLRTSSDPQAAAETIEREVSDEFS